KCAIIWELGNKGTEAEKAVSHLSKILLKGTNWRERVWTAWSLGRIGSKKAQKTLQKIINKPYTSEEEETVVTIAEHALNYLIMGMEFDLPTSPILDEDFGENNI
ncbi:MAG: HEAT repeat domain-containing protein, partial [Candidatus Heimdallarchaeota archaeon]|nr:HEAT repeat domain-containing protein [Candidatus Heimdallarchaeota archaeon]